MNGDSLIALVETQLDQVQAAMEQLKTTLTKADEAELSEDQEDRLMLVLIKFARCMAKDAPAR